MVAHPFPNPNQLGVEGVTVSEDEVARLIGHWPVVALVLRVVAACVCAFTVA
jgi:hypothetical protein